MSYAIQKTYKDYALRYNIQSLLRRVARYLCTPGAISQSPLTRESNILESHLVSMNAPSYDQLRLNFRGNGVRNLEVRLAV